jgi:hypothetical protein
MNKTYVSKFSVLSIVVVTILLAFGIEFCPPINDDLGYAMPFKDYLVGGKPFQFKMITDSIVYRFLYDNARLCNVINILLTPLPRLIGTVGSALAFMYVCFAGAKFSKIRRNSTLVTLWVAYMVIFFPWIDQMYLIDFQINYLWSSAFAIFLASAFLRQSKYKTSMLAVSSLLFGAWHEGFSLPMLFVFVLLAFRYKHLRTKKTYVMITSLSIGLAYLISAISFNEENVFPNLIERFVMMSPYLLPLLATLIIVLFKRRKITARIIVLMVPSVISAAMMIYFGRGPRIGALSIVFSGICLLLLLRKLKSNKILAGVIFSLTVLHLVAVDVQAYKAHVDYKYVLGEYAKNPDKTIYSNMVLRGNAPWYCLQKPYYDFFAHASSLYVISSFYGDSNHQLSVVPSALKNFSIEDAKKIDGNVDIYYYNDLMVMNDVVEFPGVGTFFVDYGYGEKKSDFTVIPFVSTRDNKKYLWVYPNHSNVLQLINPKPIAFNDYE